MQIPFDNTYLTLPERCFARQTPTPAPAPELIRINTQLATQLRIDPAQLASPDGLAALSGNRLPEGAEPIAQAYAGHQFGHFVPQLGDGRAILLGEVIDRHGKRYDIQLKGAGQTPFSRNGDGKSALGPVLREYIVSEAMAALGVPTTRALSAVSTGENVWRPEGELPGGIFTRVASSHLRVGTFQYFYARNDTEALKALADYTIARHYPEAAQAERPYQALLQSVADAQARLIPQWLSLGFIHGVMNTDNTALSGETIDFGPCAFMDEFHPEKVFSSIDTQGRYAWGNQGNIALWNLTRFAETLLPLLHSDPAKAQPLAETTLKTFPTTFQDQYQKRFQAKLGLAPDTPAETISETLQLLANQAIDFTQFFRYLTRVASGEPCDQLESLFPDTAPLQTWLKTWQQHLAPEAPALMAAANPILIPRNHRIEETIQSAYRGDYAPFHRLVKALARPYDEQAEYPDLENAPTDSERVRQTFCGT